jgi:hypothetical protein
MSEQPFCLTRGVVLVTPFATGLDGRAELQSWGQRKLKY